MRLALPCRSRHPDLTNHRLVLNTSVADVVEKKENTAVFGMVQGSIMIGSACGLLGTHSL